jgi:multiple sugar transport system permease protein
MLNSANQVRRPFRWRRKIVLGIRHLIIIPIVALFLLPLVWMITTSLRATGQPPPLTIDWVPSDPVWENYGQVSDLVDFWRFALNSLFVVSLAVPLTVLIGSWAGFSLSQLPQLWRLRLTALSFVALMTPLTAIWLTRFLIYKEFGLIDNRLSLVVPALIATSPFYVLLFMWTFLRVPSEIFDAARLDGAGAFRTWAGIAMPLATPTIMAVAVLSFAYHWSAFIEPLIYIQSTDKLTLQTGLKALATLDRTNWPVLMAGAVMVTAPVVLVFLLMQRAFLREVRGSGWLGR